MARCTPRWGPIWSSIRSPRGRRGDLENRHTGALREWVILLRSRQSGENLADEANDLWGTERDLAPVGRGMHLRTLIGCALVETEISTMGMYSKDGGDGGTRSAAHLLLTDHGP